MGVDRGRPHPHEQVLSPADDFADRLTGEVDGGMLRHADVAGGELLPGERSMEPACGEPDGVSLGHAQSIRRPLGWDWKPASRSGSSHAVRLTGTPSTDSIVMFRKAPRWTARAKADAAAARRAGSPSKLSALRPPRSR